MVGSCADSTEVFAVNCHFLTWINTLKQPLIAPQLTLNQLNILVESQLMLTDMPTSVDQ